MDTRFTCPFSGPLQSVIAFNPGPRFRQDPSSHPIWFFQVVCLDAISWWTLWKSRLGYIKKRDPSLLDTFLIIILSIQSITHSNNNNSPTTTSNQNHHHFNHPKSTYHNHPTCLPRTTPPSSPTSTPPPALSRTLLAISLATAAIRYVHGPLTSHSSFPHN